MGPRSHEYKFSLADVGRVIFPTVLMFSALVGLLNGARFLRALPPPAPALDPNSTLLAHQAREACSHDPARILLIGDSTCLLDVDAAALSRQLHGTNLVMNLALLSWFDLRDYGELAAEFARNNPGQIRAVVLLVTPEKLGISRSEVQEKVWEHLRLSAENQFERDDFGGPDRLGVEVLRQDFLGHLLATPLRSGSAGAAYFGFSSGVDAYVTAHCGSSLDFGSLVVPGKPVERAWALAPDLQAQTEGLRLEIPPGARLVAGFTPVARSYWQPADRRQQERTLQDWNRWLRADVLLTNLPLYMPDILFASKAHLNGLGQKRFTALLARELSVALGQADDGAVRSH